MGRPARSSFAALGRGRLPRTCTLGARQSFSASPSPPRSRGTVRRATARAAAQAEPGLFDLPARDPLDVRLEERAQRAPLDRWRRDVDDLAGIAADQVVVGLDVAVVERLAAGADELPQQPGAHEHAQVQVHRRQAQVLAPIAQRLVQGLGALVAAPTAHVRQDGLAWPAVAQTARAQHLAHLLGPHRRPRPPPRWPAAFPSGSMARSSRIGLLRALPDPIWTQG